MNEKTESCGKSPLVLCLTNSVAANFTANCLLAVGARPAMVEEPAEAEELAVAADAMLINVGTVHARQAEAMLRAAKAAARAGTPWVLDPVGVQFLGYRRELVRELIALKPSLIRGNREEIDFLGETGVVTLATGETDRIFGGSGEQSDVRSVSGGVPLLQAVTATGCAQGGICAAFLGRGLDSLEAALAASSLMKRAGERAWERAQAPGSFQIALIDALWQLNA